MGQQRDPVRHERSNPVARLQAQADVAGSERIGFFVHLLPRLFLPERYDRVALRVFLQTGQEQAVEGRGRVGKIKAGNFHRAQAKDGPAGRQTRKPAAESGELLEVQ